MREDEEDFFDELAAPTLFRLSGVDTNLDEMLLGDCLTAVLQTQTGTGTETGTITVTADNKSKNKTENKNKNKNENENENENETSPSYLADVVDAENGTILFFVHNDVDGTGAAACSASCDDDRVLQLLWEYIALLSSSSPSSSSSSLPKVPDPNWIPNPNTASVGIADADYEEGNDDLVEYITEEEAYQMWLDHQASGCGEYDDDSDGYEYGGDAKNGKNDNEDGGQAAADDDDDKVTSPDGALVRPRHGRAPAAARDAARAKTETETQTETNASIPPGMSRSTARQLERDPGLLTEDNVPRVHYREVLKHLLSSSSSSVSASDESSSNPLLLLLLLHLQDFGSRPLVIVGLDSDENNNENENNNNNNNNNNENEKSNHKLLSDFSQSLRDTIRSHGTDTVVRTGNRETLVKNGFHNSRARPLSEVGVVAGALLGKSHEEDENENEDGVASALEGNVGVGVDATIVFNPVQELPEAFRSGSVLGRWIDRPETNDNDNDNDNDSPERNRNRVFPNALWTSILAPKKCNDRSNDDIGDDDDDDETEKQSSSSSSNNSVKFTLCMANEGFGIGMHKHGPALFFLTEGRKKWYLSHPDPIDNLLAEEREERETQRQAEAEAIAGKRSTSKSKSKSNNKSNNNNKNCSRTHPAFYRELSSHKCLQEPGELLLVPNLWYHEIYNVKGPTIGIQALADERATPGAL